MFPKTLLTLVLAGLLIHAAPAQDHSHHAMTPDELAELRQKVPLYRDMTDAQIMQNMMRMGGSINLYVSAPELRGSTGILLLGHGYGEAGNALFRDAFLATGEKYPTSLGLGMAMMSGDFVQDAVDDLTRAGADTILVIPITTQMTGKLIGQWRYLFGEQEQAPWLSVDRIQTDARVIFGPTPSDDPLITEILLDFARENSSDAAREVIVLIAHGATEDAANRNDLAILARHVARIKATGEFADARGFSLQDDAPGGIRAANVDKIRNWIEAAADAGQTPIVLTTLSVRGRVQPKIQQDLAGLDVIFVEQGLTEHPRFSDWIDAVIADVQE